MFGLIFVFVAGSVHQSVWTRLRIAGGQAGVRSSSVCLQRLVTTS